MSADRPRPGEIWEMRVTVSSRTDEEVEYRPAEAYVRAVKRSLPRELFERSFRASGSSWVRQVRIANVESSEVAYDPLTEQGPRQHVQTPVFLATFSRSALASNSGETT